MRAVKNDSFTGGNRRAIPFAARRLREEMPRHVVLQPCFAGTIVLVPVPRSAPLVQGGLWPAMQLCRALQREGVGMDIVAMLERHSAVPKSATAAFGQRPGPQQHYDSLAIAPTPPLPAPQHHIVIVDDVVTRGATLLASYARISEICPEVMISCFALIRTMSGVEVNTILSPATGKISYFGGHVHRDP